MVFETMQAMQDRVANFNKVDNKAEFQPTHKRC
jgi:hypothetical protein